MWAVLTLVGDVVISVALILFTLPLIGFISLAIKLDSDGPVFAWYPGLGPDGRRFFVVKFRTTERDPDRTAWDRKSSKRDRPARPLTGSGRGNCSWARRPWR